MGLHFSFRPVGLLLVFFSFCFQSISTIADRQRPFLTPLSQPPTFAPIAVLSMIFPCPSCLQPCCSLWPLLHLCKYPALKLREQNSPLLGVLLPGVSFLSFRPSQPTEQRNMCVNSNPCIHTSTNISICSHLSILKLNMSSYCLQF